MNVKLENFLDLKGVGKMLAHASDEEQAAFFNGMSDHWNRVLLTGSSGMDMQHCFMTEKFTRQTEDFIINMAEYCKLNQENRLKETK